MNVRPATRIPSGISDEAGSIGAVESNGGLLDVIDLAKGERIALSESRMTPLFLRGRQLLAHKRDPETYAVLLELLQIGDAHLDSLWTAELGLPGWALEDAAALSLDAEWGDDTFDISWMARRASSGGIMRSQEYARAGAGQVRIHGESGAIVHTEEREPAFVDAADAYELALSLELVPYWRGPERLEAPWSTDGRETYLTRRGIGGGSGVFLRFRGNDEEPEEREVALAEHMLQDPVLTMDGGMVLLFSGAGWDLFSALDGAARGRLPLEREVEEVSILGSTVIYALDEKRIGPYQTATRVRRTLRALDLESGALLWTYALHDKEPPPDPRTIPEGGPPSMP